MIDWTLPLWTAALSHHNPSDHDDGLSLQRMSAHDGQCLFAQPYRRERRLQH